MQKWFGNKPTMLQKTIKTKYEKVLIHAEHNILNSNEIVLKVIEAEFDKKSGKEIDGVLALTNYRFLFIGKREHQAFNYNDINNIEINTDGKDKNEWKLTLYLGRFRQNFDDIKKNDDAQEFFDILEHRILTPNVDILTTVTHDFNYFLHADRLDELREKNIKFTPFLMKRDDMGFSKNGNRLLKEKHPHALLIVEGHYREKDKKGNFIVVDKLVYLYEYDNEQRKAKKVFAWPFSYFNDMTIDHFAIKSEIVGNEGKLVLNESGKQFVSILSDEGISFKKKTRKWYQKILGFRSGKWWKASIASLSYLFILMIMSSMIFAEDSEETKSPETEKNQAVTTNVEVKQEETKEDKQKEEAQKLAEEKQKQEEAARLAEEQRKKEETARLAEEQRQQEEAARLAEEQRQQEEAARLAEEQRQKEAATNVFYKNCTAVREAGAAPIHRGEPGYAKHLDRDGDGIACDR